MRFRTTVLASVITAALLLPGAALAQPSHFGRMFPHLHGLTSPTQQQLADLAQGMLDDNTDDALNNLDVPSGFTYFGQFLDHDLTLDTSPTPKAFVDPTTLTNGRTFRFDLDSLYGGGPNVSPQLYDGARLRVQNPSGNDVVDLPREADGSATLIEHRNDENEIISQIHSTMILAHNRLIDEGATFSQAQRILTLHYQWAIVHDYLPAIIGQDVVDSILRRNGDVRTRFYRPTSNDHPVTPVEFSVAAFRFGHSEVRKAYEVNEDTGKIDVFSFTDPDLRGGQPLPEGRQIEWGNFFNELVDPEDADGINHTRLIDDRISSSLFQLPIPGAEAEGSNVLAFRNMSRARFYRMPSGQDVSKAMGIRPITPAQLHLGKAFRNGTPLWYYILAESRVRENGQRLGPVGARLVGEVFLKLLDVDRNSYLHARHFQPDPEIAGEDGEMTLSDFFVFAGVADLPGDAPAEEALGARKAPPVDQKPAALAALTAPVLEPPATDAPAVPEPTPPAPSPVPTPEPVPTPTTPTEPAPVPEPDPPLAQILAALGTGQWMTGSQVQIQSGLPSSYDVSRALYALYADGRIEQEVRADDVYWRVP